MPRRIVTPTYTPSNNDVDAIATTQTPSGAGSLTLDGTLASGGVATLGTAQHVTITGAANDSGRTFTITGTDRYGNALTETINPGPNIGTVSGSKNFATVTDVSIDAAAAGAIEVGVNGLFESGWIPLNHRSQVEFNVGFAVVTTGQGTGTYSAEYTYDDVEALGENGVTAFTHSTVATETASQDGSITNPVAAIRIKATVDEAGVDYTMTILEMGY